MAREHVLVRVERDLLEPVGPQWRWLLALGIASALLGLVGLGFLVALTLTSVVVFGILVFVVGIFQLVHAFGVRVWGARLIYGGLGALGVLVGLAVFNDPLAASVWLTLVIGALLLISGILRAVLYARFPGAPGRGWLLASAILGALLGLLLILGLPETGRWFIGLAIALDLLFGGAFWVVTALEARDRRRGPLA